MAIMWLLASLAVPGSHVSIVARIAALPIFFGLIGQGISELQSGKLRPGISGIGDLLVYAIYLWLSGSVVWSGRIPKTTS